MIIPDFLPQLRHGAGSTPQDGGCLVQVAGFLWDDHSWTDDTPCVHPLLREAGIAINDRLDDAGLRRLSLLSARIAGTGTWVESWTELDQRVLAVRLAIFAVRSAPQRPEGRAALDAAEAWAVCPCKEHADAASVAAYKIKIRAPDPVAAAARGPSPMSPTATPNAPSGSPPTPPTRAATSSTGTRPSWTSSTASPAAPLTRSPKPKPRPSAPHGDVMNTHRHTKENTMTKTITIDGTPYVPVSEAGPAPEWLIVVVRDRWNLVGAVHREDDGDLVITEGHVITYWGTTTGLSELAAGGPTDKTRLSSPAGTYRVPAGSVIFTLDTEASLWS